MFTMSPPFLKYRYTRIEFFVGECLKAPSDIITMLAQPSYLTDTYHLASIDQLRRGSSTPSCFKSSSAKHSTKPFTADPELRSPQASPVVSSARRRVYLAFGGAKHLLARSALLIFLLLRNTRCTTLSPSILYIISLFLLHCY